MLRELRIKDFTIIDDLSIMLGQGFNVLTGETGAGKSIIVDALGLLLGEKASPDLIRTGCAEARVEAYFDPADIPALADLSIDGNDGIILRRLLSAKGKGRAYINDTAVSLQTIANIGKELVDIHGQHEHQGLLKKDSHLAFVDFFGGFSLETAALQSLYKEIAALREKVTQTNDRIRERGQKMDFLRFQVAEIDSAGLKDGEKHTLEDERAVLMHATKLRESSEAAYDILYGAEGSTLVQLSKAVNLVRDMSHIDRAAEEGLSLLQSAEPLLEDASNLLRKLKETYDIDPGRLTEVDDRLDLIRKLEKKYGEGIEAILLYCSRAREELLGLEQAEEQREGYEKELADRETHLSVAAEELSKKRMAAAGKMSALVIQELKELGFQKADFVVDISRRNSVAPSGLDDVEFLFSANPGEPPRPLVKIASGGELSRIMLGLKCLEIERPDTEQAKVSGESGDADRSPRTLIFDEVDAGIGGVTAQHVGARLNSLAGNYQVLCITHLPQIAARADTHLRVEKELSQKDVKVRVVELSGEKRREELARMLGGRITDRSLQHAEEMLEIDGQRSE